MVIRKVYLDHSATTPTRPEVVEAMKPYFTDIFGNASSLHAFGQEARKALADARENIAALIGAKSDEIIFTGCGTEADNMALKGVALANRDKGNHIITTQIEHHAIIYTCQFLETQGFKVTYLEVDKNGRLDPESVRKAITPHTILVSVMQANNEVGAIEPIAEIGQIIAAENANRNHPGQPQVYFHTDAVQSAGKIKINVNVNNKYLITFHLRLLYMLLLPLKNYLMYHLPYILTFILFYQRGINKEINFFI